MKPSIVVKTGLNTFDVFRVTDYSKLPLNGKLFTSTGYPRNKVEKLGTINFVVEGNKVTNVRVIDSYIEDTY